jgi:hypothetical protein
MYLLTVTISGRTAGGPIVIVVDHANDTTFGSFHTGGSISAACVTTAIAAGQLTVPVATIEYWQAQSIGETGRATKHRNVVVFVQGMSARDRCRQNKEKVRGVGELHREIRRGIY